jgi:hypothetical protein
LLARFDLGDGRADQLGADALSPGEFAPPALTVSCVVPVVPYGLKTLTAPSRVVSADGLAQLGTHLDDRRARRTGVRVIHPEA